MIGNIECESSEEFVDKLDLAKDKGLSLALDFYCTCRNGRFEDDQLYAIYEKDDIRGLIEKLKSCLDADNKSQ